MRVDARSSHLYTAQPSQATAVERSTGATSFSAAMTAAQADGGKQVNFTRMSRQEMRDWVNTQIRGGQMSLDDSRPFMAMTMRIPVDGGSSGEVPASSDDTFYDFTQKVRDGIQGARSRHDETTLKMLESAMQTMRRYQDQSTHIDTRA